MKRFLKRFDESTAFAIIEPYVKDIDPNDYSTTAEYMNALNDYVRYNLFSLYADETADLENKFGFHIDEILVRYINSIMN
jgi:hypothetical protein